MRDRFALFLLRLAARLVTWGDPYDRIIDAIAQQRRLIASEAVSTRSEDITTCDAADP